MKFFYYINNDERGEFYADVRDEQDNTVYEIHGFDIFEDGWMKHKNDIEGLHEYLKWTLNVLPLGATLEHGK